MAWAINALICSLLLLSLASLRSRVRLVTWASSSSISARGAAAAAAARGVSRTGGSIDSCLILGLAFPYFISKFLIDCFALRSFISNSKLVNRLKCVFF